MTEFYKQGQKDFRSGNWDNPYTPDTPENTFKMNEWDEGFYALSRFDDDNPLNPQ